MGAQGGGGDAGYIVFADPAVEAVLMANGVSSDGVGISLEDAAAVTSIGTWFQGNTEITHFDELEKFTSLANLGTNTVTTLGCFKGCSNLTSIAIPDSVAQIGAACFYDCTSLASIDGLANVTNLLNAAFYNTSALAQAIEMPLLTTMVGSAFYNSGLTRFVAPKVAALGNLSNLTNGGAFYNCTNLTYVELGEVTSISRAAFWGCAQLSTVIIDNETPPTLGDNAFTYTYIASGTGYIYVPDASVSAYQSATNWATYAAQIKPMSELNA